MTETKRVYVAPKLRTVVPLQVNEPPVLAGESGPSEAGWHSIEDFLRCPKAYQFKHIRHVRKPLTQNPDAFSVGSLFHAGRARWFTHRFDTSEKTWTSIKQAVEEEAAKQKLPVTLKAEQTTLVYLQEYVDYWSKRPRPRPLATEYKIGPAPLIKGDNFFWWRTAKLDDVSTYPEAGNKQCIGESKTTSDSVYDCVEQYTLHGQPILQVLLWKMSEQGEAKHGPVAGVMLDVIQKGYGGKRSKFSRVFLPVTDYALDWFARNLRAQLKAASMLDWNSDAPRLTTGCTYKAGRGRVSCDFRELCMHGRSATMKYVLQNGESLLTWKKNDEQQVAPWL